MVAALSANPKFPPLHPTLLPLGKARLKAIWLEELGRKLPIPTPDHSDPLIGLSVALKEFAV